MEISKTAVPSLKNVYQFEKISFKKTTTKTDLLDNININNIGFGTFEFYDLIHTHLFGL